MDKQSLQLAVLSIANNASKFVISNRMVSGAVVLVVVSNATPGVPEFFLVKAERLDVSLLCKAFTFKL